MWVHPYCVLLNAEQTSIKIFSTGNLCVLFWNQLLTVLPFHGVCRSRDMRDR
jgi:hypothetical protein